MDAVNIVILVLAILAVVSLARLAVTIARLWSGGIEDIFEDVVIHRAIRFALYTGLLIAALLLQGRMRSLLSVMFE